MQSFSSNGVSIAFMDSPSEQGRGEPILLIHGFASNHAVNWVDTGWVSTLNKAGYRVIALDNRGHGQSEKLYDPADYASQLMAADAVRLLDYLDIEDAHIMGYSMGARITAYFALQYPHRARTALLGGLGNHLINGVGLPLSIAEAMEVPSVDVLIDPMQRMFRSFAERTKSDLRALAACIRGSRQTMTPDEVAQIKTPVLISVGTKDDVAGSPHELADLFPNAEALDIPGRDHNLAVGDRVHKQGVLDFLAQFG
ncbi:alpha/beta fold hydrolase [Microvirga sp. W0021]|uniref:Alpha/beta fold hydrolase n=1 Tax=Hohaiivirga grylli TaxID=3133970 RepID=A0ABV0BMK4_9HYPH